MADHDKQDGSEPRHWWEMAKVCRDLWRETNGHLAALGGHCLSGAIVEAIDDLTTATNRQTDALKDQTKTIAALLDQIVNPKATNLGGPTMTAIPKGSPLPGSSTMFFEKLDYKLDQEDAICGPLSPDGKVDPPVPPATTPFSWAGVSIVTAADGTVSEEDLGSKMEVRADGKLAGVRLPVDVDVFEFRVVATASVDKADTTEIETISNVYHGKGEHTQATDLGGTGLGAIAKGAALP